MNAARKQAAALASLRRYVREKRIIVAEDLAYAPIEGRRMRSADVPTVQAWADLVMAHPAVVARWGWLTCDVSAAPCLLDSSGGKALAKIYTGTGIIEIRDDEPCTFGTLMHELAHRVCVAEYGLRVAPHGSEFAQSHLNLAREVLGPAFHIQLLSQYRLQKVITV